MNKKIKYALEQIKVDKDCNWFVPNKKMLNMTTEEFIKFERARLKEFDNEQIRTTKYKHHYE